MSASNSERSPHPGPRWTWQWVLLLLLIVLVSEIATRVEERISFGVPLLSRVTGPDDLVMRHPDGARGRPGARYQKWGLNQSGFRGPEISNVPNEGRTRVVVVGASETFGLYEAPGKEYARQLEDSLRAGAATACGDHFVPPEVVNAGLPGMATPSMELLVDQVIRPLDPDVLVLYPSPGFYLNPRAPRATRGRDGDAILPPENALHLRVVGRAIRQVKMLIPNPVKGWLREIVVSRRSSETEGPLFVEVPRDRLEQFDTDLRRLIGVSKTVAEKVVLMGHANATMEPGFADSVLLGAWVYQFPQSTGRTLVDFHSRAVERERAAAQDSGLAFVDLPRMFSDRWKTSFADFVHFTDVGAGIVAATLAQELRPVIRCAP